MLLQIQNSQNYSRLKFDHFDRLFDEYDKTHRQPLSQRTRKFWNKYAGTQGEEVCIALMEAIESENPDAIRNIAKTLEDVIALQKRPKVDKLRERIAMFSAAENGKPIDELLLYNLLCGEFPKLDRAYFGRVCKKMDIPRLVGPVGAPLKTGQIQKKKRV